jgi:adenylate cyclase
MVDRAETMLRPSWLRQAISQGVILGLVCALAAWLLSRPPLLRGIDEWLFDACFQARGTRPTTAKIVLVGLDAESLERLGKPAAFLSPELAEVVAFLKQEGAAAIGIDLIIPKSLEQNPALENLLEADKLGQAIYDADNVVLAKWNTGDAWLLPLTQWRFKSLTERARPTDLGFVNLQDDTDYFIRRQQLVSPEGDWQFALALHAVASGCDLRWENGLLVGRERVPLDNRQCLRINFVGPPGSFPLVPFHEALEAARRRQSLPVDVRGAIVIIGGTEGDIHATPYGNRFYGHVFNADPGLMAGAELHAHILATLADGAYLRIPPEPLSFAVLLVVGALLGGLFRHVNLEGGVLLALVHHFGWLLTALASFFFFRLRIEMVSMLLLGVLLYGITFGQRWRRLRRMFGVFQSESIARTLEASTTPLELRGDARIVTVLFADVRQFTSFAEKHSPQEVVALLNSYFEAIVPIIEEHGGTLNSYMGDGIMVIFGAPEFCSDHALRAVRAALAMVRRVHHFGPRWAALGYPDFRIGVGMHSGEVVIGMIGSPRRLAYTAIGDTVNAAARIEAENKRIGSEILLSAQTRSALSEEECDRLGIAHEHQPVLVKGKSQPLDIYRVHVDGGH